MCRVLFALDVQYTGSIEHAQPSNSTSTEQPTCPVCLGTFHICFVSIWIYFEFISVTICLSSMEHSELNMFKSLLQDVFFFFCKAAFKKI